MNHHVLQPKVGVMRQVLVSDTDEEALAAAQSAHSDWYHSITKLWHARGDHTPDELFDWEPSTQNQTIIFGSPERVKEQIVEFIEQAECN